MSQPTSAWPIVCLVLVLAFAPAAARQSDGHIVEQERVHWKEIAVGKARIQLYGFLRTDAIRDDSRADSSQSPFYILAEDPNLGRSDMEDFTLHPRLTRLGIGFEGPVIDHLAGGRMIGALETDFQNGGKESKPIIRIRHAYLRLAWRTISLLAGQTWDVVAPLYPTVNNDSLMWNAGNLGGRRPQIRLTWEPEAGAGVVSVTGAAGLTGAVDPQDLDSDGTRDGEASGRPNVQARVGYSRPLGSPDRRLGLGVYGHQTRTETRTPVGGKTVFRSWSAGIDYEVPLVRRVALRGEAWTGFNLSDFNGGILQGVNSDPADPACGEEIASRGGWIEIAVRVAEHVTLHPGYTVDDPEDEQVPSGGRTRNEAWFLVNRWQPDPSFLLGLDFLRWATDYRGLEGGADNRVNLYLQYSF